MRRQDELITMFEAIDEDGRKYVLAILRGEYERATKSLRPRLRLIDCRQSKADLAKNQGNPLSVGGAS